MGFATPRARDGPRRSVAGRRRIPQARQAPSPSRAWAVAGDWIAAILPLLALLAALAVWFGVTLVKTRARYFGLDPSVLGFSTRDYVLRSSTELLEPMLYLLWAASPSWRSTWPSGGRCRSRDGPAPWSWPPLSPYLSACSP